jgi:hypothetical protein
MMVVEKKINSSFRYYIQRQLVPSGFWKEKDLQREGLLQVCVQTFKFVHQLAECELRWLQSQFNKGEFRYEEKLPFIKRLHGNTGRVPINKLSPRQQDFFLAYLVFLKENICAPYAGFDETDSSSSPTGIVYFLPPWFTYKILHQLYAKIATHYVVKAVAQTKFQQLWRQHASLIEFQGRRTAACDDCVLFKRQKQRHSTAHLQHLAFKDSIRKLVNYWLDRYCIFLIG